MTEGHQIVWRDIHITDPDEYEEIPVCGLCVPKHSSFRTRADVPEGGCEEIRARAVLAARLFDVPLHLMLPDPSPCPTCLGERNLHQCDDADCWDWTPVCGEPTSTPPLCARDQREQDDVEAARAYREGRYE